MRIIYHHRIASKDGQYVHVEEIISSLTKLGHEVITCEPGSIRATRFGSGSKIVEKLRAVLPGFVHEFAEFLYSIPDYMRVKKAIRRHRPDFIYERYNIFFTSGIWASKRYGIPIVLEVNAPLFEERSNIHGISLSRLARWSEDYVWRNADIVLPVTQVLGTMVEARGVDENRIHVIPNGINAHFSEGMVPVETVDTVYGLTGKLVLGFTGFVREWHRLDRVLQVIAANPSENWHLLLVGDGPDRDRLEAMADTLGVRDRFTITGIVDRYAIAGFIQRFDVALQPDVVPYASPLKMFEYMYMAKPILAPDTSNIREILKDGDNALLFSVNDTTFTDALVRLCRDSELRWRLGSSAQATIDRMGLYWDCNAAKIVDLAGQLVGMRAQLLADKS